MTIKDKDIIADLKSLIADMKDLIVMKDNVINTQREVMICVVQAVENNALHKVLPTLKEIIKRGA